MIFFTAVRCRGLIPEKNALLLENAAFVPPPPPPPGTCTETRREDNIADIFSLDLLSAPKPKLFVKKEICDFCAEKSTKILKATAFFFFLSFLRGKFSLSLFSVRGRKKAAN
jgi:hypothetical protein